MMTDGSVKIFDPRQHYQPVTVTPAALNYIQKKLQARGYGIGLRLGVKRAGCSGLEYVVDYVDVQQSTDEVFLAADHLAIYVDKKDLPIVHGTVIDYVQKGIVGGELVFNNPNAKVSCGCGESFNV